MFNDHLEFTDPIVMYAKRQIWESTTLIIAINLKEFRETRAFYVVKYRQELCKLFDYRLAVTSFRSVLNLLHLTFSISVVLLILVLISGVFWATERNMKNIYA